MKYAAVAAAMAAGASAGSTLSVSWEPIPTSSSTTWTTWDPKPSTWSTWDPKSTTWTTWDPKPTTTSTWSDWGVLSKTTTTTTSSSCTYTTVVPTTKCDEKNNCWPDKYTSTIYADKCTWSDWDPKPTTTTWSDWGVVVSSTTTTTTTTPTSCTYTTVVPTTKCDEKNNCWPDKYTSTIYADKCTWSDWDPKPTTTSTWSDWGVVSKTTTTTTPSKCSYVTVTPTHKCDQSGKCWDESVTTTLYADTCTWAQWTSTTTSSSKCSYVTSVPTTYCVEGHPDWCWPDTTTTTMYADKCTWAPWSTSVTPTTSGKCSYVTPVTTSKCAPGHSDWCVPVTYTSTMYADQCTWDGWNSKSTPVVKTTSTAWNTWATVPSVVKSTVTKASTWAVVTSVVTPGWSSDGWFGAAWSTAGADKCAMNVVTSYGAPVWKPTPVVSTKSAATTWATMGASSTGHAAIAPAGNKWSMTYSPYNANGVCKAVVDIKVDLTNIKSLGFTTVRIYSTDCEILVAVEEVYQECGLKVILGVFIDKTGVSGAGQQVKDIIAWSKWECVELIVIGNEAVFQGFCSAEELVVFISDCKSQFSAAGYTGSCTTTEPLAQWQQYGSQFCGVVDVVAANLYAFFNADCPAENAGTFIAAEITILEGICGDSKQKDVYVMECGWPSEGSCNGAACPGVSQQATAIKAIQEECGEQIVFFSFEDEVWKQPGQFGVEQHWGCSDVFGTVKSSPTTTWAALPATTTTTKATSWATV